MSREKDETEAAESVLSKLLAGRSLLEVFTPSRETTALLEELRRDPWTRAILDGSRLDQTPPVSHDETDQPPARSRGPASPADHSTSDILRMVVDYGNGMTQEEIARKHGLRIQTIRKTAQGRRRGDTLTQHRANRAGPG